MDMAEQLRAAAAMMKGMKQKMEAPKAEPEM